MLIPLKIIVILLTFLLCDLKCFFNLFSNNSVVQNEYEGSWVSQWVKCLTIDFSSGLHLKAVNSSPVLSSTLGVELTLKKESMN